AHLYHSRDDSVALVAQTVILYVFENILKLITSIHAILNWGTVAGVGFALPNRREALIISLVIFSALAKLHIVFLLLEAYYTWQLHIDNLTSSKIDVVPKFCTDNVSPERNWLGRIR
ncbi:hypothetical protein Goari_020672, partial [Gossypium aridum]|nr:hypothetical protein [Gossypium aridum]